MCRATPDAPAAQSSACSAGAMTTTACCADKILNNKTSSFPGTLFGPIHPILALAMLPLLPTWFFLNRGYTQWFHWTFIFYMITGKKDFWRRFLVIQGAAVTVGWYAAVVYDFCAYGRLCHLLYNNMPSNMRAIMLVDGRLASGGIIFDNLPALSMIAASHIIDFLAHPWLSYVAWKMHASRGGTVRNLITWDVFWGTIALSRIYSMTHMYYNDGLVSGLFYYGYEVYNIDSLDAYTAAYVAEGAFFVLLGISKLYLQWSKVEVKIRIGDKRMENYESVTQTRAGNRSIQKYEDKWDQQKPTLIHSASCFSTQSSFTESCDHDQ